MRLFVALSILTSLSLTAFSANCREDINLNHSGLQNSDLQIHLFDGIQFSEVQRQHMRDLMQQVQQDSPPVTADDQEELYLLVTAANFDEQAVSDLINRVAKQQADRQIEMAKVRHRMYYLLTPVQQQTVEKNYQLRIESLRQNDQ